LSRDQWLAGRPALSAFNRQVIEVWRWCVGWKPERILAASEYHGISDVELLVGQLLALRSAVEAHQEFQRKAHRR